MDHSTMLGCWFLWGSVYVHHEITMLWSTTLVPKLTIKKGNWHRLWQLVAWHRTMNWKRCIQTNTSDMHGYRYPWVWVSVSNQIPVQNPSPIAMGVAPVGIWWFGKQCHYHSMLINPSLPIPHLLPHIYYIYVFIWQVLPMSDEKEIS